MHVINLDRNLVISNSNKTDIWLNQTQARQMFKFEEFIVKKFDCTVNL